MPDPFIPPFSVTEAVRASKLEKIRTYPCHVNRASELGSECERYLVYARTAWEKKLAHTVESEFIFEAGRRIEDEAVDELKAAGFQIIEQQRSFEWREYNITGHMDLKISQDGKTAYPCEIKSMNQFIFQKINTIEDMMESNKPWVRKYPAQLYLYMLMSDTDLGLFYLKDKATHQPKEIWVPLDYGYAEGLIQRAERVNKHVEAGTLPEGHPGASCGFCGFRHLCLPDQDFGPGVVIMDDTELEEKLKRRSELEAAKKEYDALDKGVKGWAKGKENVVIGDYLIEGKEYQRKSFDIPAEVKAQYACKTAYWKTTITSLRG